MRIAFQSKPEDKARFFVRISEFSFAAYPVQISKGLPSHSRRADFRNQFAPFAATGNWRGHFAPGCLLRLSPFHKFR